MARKPTTLLIDGDILAYSAATARGVQTTTEWDEDVISCVADMAAAKRVVEDIVADHLGRLKGTEAIICMSCRSRRYWRHELLPTYKAGRGTPPIALGAVKTYLREHYTTFERPGLEADDVMGILQTGNIKGVAGRKIIVSADKDMLTIPGLIWRNPDEGLLEISEAEADYRHLCQALTGDRTDGYLGCPGVGPKKAEKILFGVSPPWGAVSEMWPAVVEAYEKAGLTEEDALLQARVARICRASDYDFKAKEVKLWNPS